MLAFESVEGLVRKAMNLAPGLELVLEQCSSFQTHGLFQQ